MPAPGAVRGTEGLLLRRMVVRLCAMAAGHDDSVDGQLLRLGEAMHRYSDGDELEQLLIALTEVAGPVEEVLPSELESADVAQDAVAATPMFARETLLHLLGRLDLAPALQRQLTGLKGEISGSNSEGEVKQAAERLAALINRQGVELQGEQAALAEILGNVTSGLDRVARHLGDEAQDREAAMQDSADLNRRLRGEVDAIDSGVRKAVSLGEAQGQVLARIQQINAHVDAFRQRELARLQDTRRRADTMKQRVEELERETVALQESVRAEQQRSCTDALTGIPNRLALQQRLAREYLHWKASGVPLGIAVWDVDHFKAINDRYGHPAGDKALRVIARQLARACRDGDFAARYGGEEFTTIIRGLDAGALMEQAEKARVSLSRLGLHCEGSEVPLTVSCGLALCVAGDGEETLLKRADAALYRAKRAGRNRCFLA